MTLQVWQRPEAGPGPAGPSGPARRPGGRRRQAAVWASAALAITLVVVGVVALRARSGNQGPLDPRNPGAAGAQALARVLEQRGLAVDVARGREELTRLGPVDRSATVLVTSTEALSAETARAAWQQVAGARRVVLVEPSRFLLDRLGLAVSPAGGTAATRAVRAGCRIDGVAPSDSISAVGRGYTSTEPDATECFAFEGSAALVRLAPDDTGRPEVIVLGAGEILSNGEITRHDNAGVAVRLLGPGDRLVWHIPSLLDVAEEDATADSEVPEALGPLLLLGLVALLAAMLWRGRRFGPLVTEPLPAVVKAIETTQSRGRLYRRARDTARAGAVLQAATGRRLAAYLGLPVGAPPARVAEATARATGRPVAEVHALLAGPPPADEDAMVALANALSTLEKEVHRP